VELLFGAGARRDRRLKWPGHEGWTRLVSVDQTPAHRPDVVCDLEFPPYPFASDSADEIHAYEVLEHLGQQGDWRAFFAQFSGYLAGTCPAPTSPWAWGDPSHRRVISTEALTFLNQRQYAEQIGVTSMSDFRPWYRADFEPRVLEERDGTFCFVLEAIKPSRIAA
jgi:hypothetical protein